MGLAEFLQQHLGNLLTTVAFLGGGLMFMSKIGAKVDGLHERVGEVEKKTDQLIQVLVTLGRYEERFLRNEQMLDDLRRGRGFIERNDDRR